MAVGGWRGTHPLGLKETTKKKVDRSRGADEVVETHFLIGLPGHYIVSKSVYCEGPPRAKVTVQLLRAQRKRREKARGQNAAPQ